MLEFFTDPILMAPTIASMLMCFVAALIGTFAVLKRYALVGEMLSHASYPGVIVAVLLWQDPYFMPLVGAGLSCFAGLWLTESMQKRFRIKADSALTFVLATFFGIGLTILTSVQNSYPALYKKMQGYLFGQAATMTHEHIYLYALLALLVATTLFVFSRLLSVSIFDPEYATVSGMNSRFANFLLLALIVLATVIGIRSVGVVLMSSMLIFPAVCARFWTVRLVPMIVLAALFGIGFGFFGIYTSHNLSIAYDTSFPSGPSIVLVAGVIFLFSALFSRKKGIVVRVARRFSFWYRCQQENLLKAIWKAADTNEITFQEIQTIFHENRMLVQITLWMLRQKKEIIKIARDRYKLTTHGAARAKKIVRLHRLWELYLVEFCGIARDRVHPSAEEMEHIITPEIEAELETLLHHPQQDPHHQPIPPYEPI